MMTSWKKALGGNNKVTGGQPESALKIEGVCWGQVTFSQ